MSVSEGSRGRGWFRPPPFSRETAAGLAVVSLFLLALLLATFGVAGRPPAGVELLFERAPGVSAGTPVTVRGQAAGEVERVELSNGRALVTVRFDRPLAIRRDGSALLSDRTPLGGRIILLDPGSSGDLTGRLTATRVVLLPELLETGVDLAGPASTVADAFARLPSAGVVVTLADQIGRQAVGRSGRSFQRLADAALSLTSMLPASGPAGERVVGTLPGDPLATLAELADWLERAADGCIRAAAAVDRQSARLLELTDRLALLTDERLVRAVLQSEGIRIGR